MQVQKNLLLTMFKAPTLLKKKKELLQQGYVT